ncbi:MAG: HAMP domain-containing protein [Acidobacteria bacterium]|nr:MAG: HAMP domain-containing protein [Acidobacteriota bacterium]
MDGTTPVPWRHRLTFRLTGAVTLLLLAIGLPFLLIFHARERSRQLEAVEEATLSLDRIVVQGLRSAMIARQPHLLDDTIRGLAHQPAVQRVILLDRSGRVAVSSDPSFEGRFFDRERDDMCRVCHEAGRAPATSRTTIVEVGRRRVLRAVSVIPNEPACHRCHDPKARTNGVLLFDFSLAGAEKRIAASFGRTAALGALMLAVTIVALTLLLNRMVHAPLNEIVRTTQKIARGRLDTRARIPGRDEFARLGSQVNAMTEHLERLLGRIERQRAELQAVLDAVDDQIVVLDRDRRIVIANRAFTAARPADAGPLADCCRGPSPEEAGGCLVDRVFETGRLAKAVVSRHTGSGDERALEVHASPVRDAAGRVIQVVEVRRDISERRQLEASLVHSERLASLGLLASGLSHEINNPLAVIAARVTALRRRLAEDGTGGEPLERLDAELDQIERATQRGRAITDRLLRLSRSTGGARSLIDVNRAVRDALALLSHEMERHAIRSETDLSPSLAPLVGDPARVTQVLMNLALNAVQAMQGRGGTLRVATRAVDGGIRIDVEDDGPGIPENDLVRIFDPFYTTKPAGQGTGLGLFICSRIVAEMGGRITAANRPGGGARFTVTLPRSRPEGDGR